jgi:YD repeat-containing protein
LQEKSKRKVFHRSAHKWYLTPMLSLELDEALMTKLYSLALAGVIACAVAGVGFFFVKPIPAVADAVTPGTVNYSYDSLGRLVGDSAAGSYSGSYDYDSAGNRVTSGLQ